MQQPPPPPPGWHDDPQDPTSFRYWDGTQWTDQRAPKAAAPAAATQSGPSDWPPQRIAAALGAVAIIVGSFSPWVTASTGFASFSKNGTDGDGQITLVAGGLILVLVAVRKYLGALIVSALCGALLIYELFDIQQRVTDMNDDDMGIASIGWGIWLAAVGAAVTLATTISLRRSNQPPMTSDTSSH